MALKIAKFGFQGGYREVPQCTQKIVVLEPTKGLHHLIPATTSVRLYPQAACRLVLGLSAINMLININNGEKSPHFIVSPG